MTRRNAGFSSSDDAYVVLLDSQGKTLARVHGKAPDEASMATLKEALVNSTNAKP